jgi:hypothetical protein
MLRDRPMTALNNPCLLTPTDRDNSATSHKPCLTSARVGRWHAPSPQAASPSRQTHAFSPLVPQPRLTRGHLRFSCSLYLGGSQGGWPRDAPCGLTKLQAALHSPSRAQPLLTSPHCTATSYAPTQRRARGGGVAPHSPPSGHVRPLSAPHPDGQTRTSPYRGVQLSGGEDWR